MIYDKTIDQLKKNTNRILKIILKKDPVYYTD